MRGFRRKLLGVGVAVSVISMGAVSSANTITSATPLTSSGLPGRPPLEPKPPLRPHAETQSPRSPASPTTAWVPLADQPPFSPGTMLLESNGSVLVQAYSTTGGGSGTWYELSPNAQGSYVDGTWSKIASMPAGYAPLYSASAILPSGQMIIEGGEYLGTTPAWTNKGAIYDPVSNTWQSVAPPPGWNNIGDAQSDVFPNGAYMLAQACQNCLTSDGTLSTQDAVFNPGTLGWTVLPGTGKSDPNDEEGWSLLPDGKLLTVDAWAPPNTETYTQRTARWSSAGNTPAVLPDTAAKEIGPQVVMPGGDTFVVGAGTSPTQTGSSCTASTKPAPTAVYDYATRTWAAGPSIPTVNGVQYDSADGPGSILPDGNVLFDVSPCVYHSTLLFYQYDPTSNTLIPVPDVPHASTDSTYFTRLLALPTGQVLFNDGSQVLVYTAGGTPKATWAPSITSISRRVLNPGGTARLSGTQLAGLSQGAAYGDDGQDNTNFPLVRITNRRSGVVTYARTSNWTSVSIAPGVRSSTDFSLPTTTPLGLSTLVVVANGIPSRPTPVVIHPAQGSPGTAG